MVIPGGTVGVPKNNTIRILFDYPFRNGKIFEYKSPRAEGGFTRRELVYTIIGRYKKMYAEEAASMTTNVDNRGMLMNRPASNGVWGIWGHDFEDLSLDSMDWNQERSLWELSISS